MVDYTMSNSNALSQLEVSIKQANEHVQFGQAIEKLRNNKDFNTVFTKGYFEAEAIRLVHLKADPKMQTPQHQEEILKQMDSIGSLNQFIQAKLHIARLALRSIEADEETREELLAEGDNNE
jgi:hypothetical protein